MFSDSIKMYSERKQVSPWRLLLESNLTGIEAYILFSYFLLEFSLREKKKRQSRIKFSSHLQSEKTFLAAVSWATKSM